MKHFFKIVVFLVLFTACSDKPKDLLTPEKITPILEDIHIVDAMLNNNNHKFMYDKEKLRYYEYIYKKYNITKKQFDSSMAYYAQHPNELRKSYTTVLKKLNFRDSILKEKQKILIDTVELWKGDTAYKFEKETKNTLNVCLPVTYQNTYTISAEIKVYDDSQLQKFTPKFVFESPDSLYVLRANKFVADTTFQNFEASGMVTDSTILDLSGAFFPAPKDKEDVFKHYEIRNIRIFTTNLRSEAEIDSILSKQ